MTTTKSAARTAQNSTVFRALARIGFVVLGIVHLVIGIIAVSVATGSGGGEADQGGAMESIRQAPFGPFLLWLIVVGLFALAIWQIVEAVVERDSDAKKKWGYRAKYVGTAVAYGAIAVTALTYATGGSSDSSESTKSLSARVLEAPGGVFLLVLVGLGVLGVGVAFVVRGFTQAFEKQLALPSGPARKGILALGMVGYIAKGVAVGITGILFVIAAVTHDPDKAGGMDAALKSLAALPFGVIILWIVGAGLIIYGVYCFARARYAKL